MKFENFPGIYPNKEQWRERRNYISFCTEEALGKNYSGESTEQTKILEYELERVFCSGAWLACIILALASSEVYVCSLEKKDGTKHIAKFLKKYKLRNDWIWLKNRRNKLVHVNDFYNYKEYMHDSHELEDDARRAVAIAIKIILLGTRDLVNGSIERSNSTQ